MLQVIEISEINACPSNRELLLSNYINKQNFVSALVCKLQRAGFHVILCPGDADTTIVKGALDIQNVPVLVMTDDTDNLYLLIHHMNVTAELY